MSYIKNREKVKKAYEEKLSIILELHDWNWVLRQLKKVSSLFPKDEIKPLLNEIRYAQKRIRRQAGRAERLKKEIDLLEKRMREE